MGVCEVGVGVRLEVVAEPGLGEFAGLAHRGCSCEEDVVD